MKSLTNRFLIIGAAALLGLYVLAAHKLGLSDESPLTLGIDLSGGTILVYQVDPDAGDRVDIDELITALKRRINPDGVFDITIRAVGDDRVEIIMPEDMAEQAVEVKRKLTEEGSLEFRILASTATAADFPARVDRVARDTDPVVDQLPDVEGFRWARVGEVVTGPAVAGAPSKVNADTIEFDGDGWEPDRFRGLEAVLVGKGEDPEIVRVPIVGNTETTLELERPHGMKAADIATVAVDYAGGDETIRDPIRDWSPNRYTDLSVVLDGLDDDGHELEGIVAQVASNTGDTLTLKRPHGLAAITGYALAYDPSGIGLVGPDQEGMQRNAAPGIEPAAAGDAVIRGVPVGGGTTQYFVLFEVPRDTMEVNGDQLERVRLAQDNGMRPAVGFDLDSAGSRRFANLTGRYRPREEGAFQYRLAILLDGEVMSAPSINDKISGSGIITMGRVGNVNEEVNYLIDILRAGSLPVALVTPPLQEETIGPTLGDDTIRKGQSAITIGLVLVPIFMILYYRFAGVVSVIALLLNMVLLLASMAVTGSSVTLPGLAGLALTIGMAVDANVLIFERMREERDRGAPLAQQIRNGFGKAWSTILDSNVTTILAGLVLWFVGTEEVKGFAIVMIIGLIWNLFTAVFVSRALFDLAYQQGWIKKLNMARLMHRTNINFVGPRRLCMAGSALAILALLGVFVTRGGLKSKGDMYDIDFTGGTLVTMRFDREQLDQLAEQAGATETGYVREQAAAQKALPSPKVERLSVQEDGQEGPPRFNVRTTEEDQEAVKAAIKSAFGDALLRVRLASFEPIENAEADETGSRFTLTFNLAQQPSKVEQTLEDVIAAAGQAENAGAKVEVVNPEDRRDEDREARVLELSTSLDPEVAESYLAALGARMVDDDDFIFERVENFGGVVAGETRQKAIVAVVLSWLIIIGYLWFRFQSVTYGVAAVVALVHDVLISLGFVAMFGYKIDLPMIAAFLTLIGFSVNDTIVIFDRIRELKGKSPHLTSRLVNDAINVTLSRTILTSLTAWTVVLVFWLFGGEGLAGFSFCLVVGFVSGTYSTIFIAAPILVEWLGKPSKKDAEALATSR